jgi:hypothetical protein
MWTHEVETTIIGDESSDLLSVLDELDTDTLSDSRVGLLGLNTDLDSQQLSLCLSRSPVPPISPDRGPNVELSSIALKSPNSLLS